MTYAEIKSLTGRQLFWETLFEEKQLAPQLATLATGHANGVTYEDDIPKYGKVQLKVESGSTLGDNFQSDTFIVTARLMQRDGEDITNTLSSFIKVLPSISALRKTVGESGLHQREINMYRHFFNYLRGMLTDKISLDVPDAYYTHIEEPAEKPAEESAEKPAEKPGSGTCILLEDLKAEGYRMVDKVEGCDYQHCRMALKSLAHYHALTISAVRKWTDPTTGKLSHIPPTVKFLLNDTTKYDSEILKYLTEFSPLILAFLKDEGRSDLLEWFTPFTLRMPDVILVDTLESSGPLVCIVHGDYWNNNVLFKYADGIPVSLRMLDFQMSRIGHPLGDVMYFLYTSTLPETRRVHMKDFLECYFNTLTADLQLIGISLDNYSMQNIWDDYKRISVMWMFRGIVSLSMTQNKQVVARMKEQDAEEKLKEPKPEDEVVSLAVEETFQKMMKTVQLSDNPILSNRIMKLIEEVYILNNPTQI